MPKSMPKTSKKKKFNSRFPPARIKKIMQTDEDVGKVAAAVPVIISRALEMFLESLLTETSKMTTAKNAKTLSTSHIKQTIMTNKQFDFLKELVANVPDHNTEDANGTGDTGISNGDPAPKKRRGRPKKSTDSQAASGMRGHSSKISPETSEDEEEEDNEEEEEDETDDENDTNEKVNSKPPERSTKAPVEAKMENESVQSSKDRPSHQPLISSHNSDMQKDISAERPNESSSNMVPFSVKPAEQHSAPLWSTHQKIPELPHPHYHHLSQSSLIAQSMATSMMIASGGHQPQSVYPASPQFTNPIPGHSGHLPQMPPAHQNSLYYQPPMSNLHHNQTQPMNLSMSSAPPASHSSFQPYAHQAFNS